MRIGVDIRVLARGESTGIQVYTREMLSQLFSCRTEHTFVLFYNAYRRVPLPAEWRQHPRVEIAASAIPNKLFDVTAMVAGVPRIDRLLGGIDVLLQPHFLRAPLSAACPRVVVVHDLSFEHNPNWFSWRSRLWHARMRPRARLRKADHLIAVSNATALDIMHTYGIAGHRISAVPSGIALERFAASNENDADAVAQIVGDNTPYLLVLAAWEPRKNIRAAIRAYERFYKRNADQSSKPFIAHGLEVERRDAARHAVPHLIIAGSAGWAERDLRECVHRSPARSHIHCVGYVAESVKPALYRSALALLFPSVFEGFGLPVLEAMAAGTPVIAGDRGALPEVVRDAGILVDPYSVHVLADAIETIVHDRQLVQQLTQAGHERARQYSWQTTAQQTLDIVETTARRYQKTQ